MPATVVTVCAQTRALVERRAAARKHLHCLIEADYIGSPCSVAPSAALTGYFTLLVRPGPEAAPEPREPPDQ